MADFGVEQSTSFAGVSRAQGKYILALRLVSAGAAVGIAVYLASIVLG